MSYGSIKAAKVTLAIVRPSVATIVKTSRAFRVYVNFTFNDKSNNSYLTIVLAMTVIRDALFKLSAYYNKKEYKRLLNFIRFS